MGQLFVFNASESDIFISFNNGAFLTAPSANSKTWQPTTLQNEPIFVNNVSPGKGELGLGDNTLAVYPETGGPSHVVNFTLSVPLDVAVNSVQLYLFWKNATSVAWVALNEGQPFQVSFIAEHSGNVTTSSVLTGSNLTTTTTTTKEANAKLTPHMVNATFPKS